MLSARTSTSTTCTPAISPQSPSIARRRPQKANGATVVICSGGGYGFLATEHEGQEAADWLNSLGVTAVVLRYRLAPKYHHPAMIQDATRDPDRAQTPRNGTWTPCVAILGFFRRGPPHPPPPPTSTSASPMPPTRSTARAAAWTWRSSSILWSRSRPLRPRGLTQEPARRQPAQGFGRDPVERTAGHQDQPPDVPRAHQRGQGRARGEQPARTRPPQGGRAGGAAPVRRRERTGSASSTGWKGHNIPPRPSLPELAPPLRGLDGGRGFRQGRARRSDLEALFQALGSFAASTLIGSSLNAFSRPLARLLTVTAECSGQYRTTTAARRPGRAHHAADVFLLRHDQWARRSA